MQKRHNKRHHLPSSLGLVAMLDIFILLVLYQSMNAIGGNEVLLPATVSSTATRTPAPITLQIQPDRLVIQGKTVIGLSPFINDRKPVIPALVKALKKLHGHTDRRPRDQAVARRSITLLGDKRIPYKLLKKIVLSCAAANYTDIVFSLTPAGAPDA